MLSVSEHKVGAHPVTFSDHKIENGSTIALAMHYIDQREVSDDRGPVLMMSVLELSKKWQIAVIPKLVQKWIREMADDSDGSARANLTSPVAMYLGFPQLAARLIELGVKRQSYPADDLSDLEQVLKAYGNTIHSAPMPEFDSTAMAENENYGNIFQHMSYSNFEALPLHWVWSVLRNCCVKNYHPENGKKTMAELRKSARHVDLILRLAHPSIDPAFDASE